jgi:hypothetical protein
MSSTSKQKMATLTFVISGVVLYFFLFDKGILALLAPAIFVFGIYMSFLAIKHDRGWRLALIPIILWVLAIIINRVSGSYEFYSEYDFIDPISGFILSVLLALIAFCLTLYYFFKRSNGLSKP